MKRALGEEQRRGGGENEEEGWASAARVRSLGARAGPAGRALVYR
ncbi:hypothetical protein [Sorangium sp. So ce233]